MAGEGDPQDAAHDMGNHLPLLPGNRRGGAGRRGAARGCGRVSGARGLARGRLGRGSGLGSGAGRGRAGRGGRAAAVTTWAPSPGVTTRVPRARTSPPGPGRPVTARGDRAASCRDGPARALCKPAACGPTALPAPRPSETPARPPRCREVGEGGARPGPPGSDGDQGHRGRGRGGARSGPPVGREREVAGPLGWGVIPSPQESCAWRVICAPEPPAARRHLPRPEGPGGWLLRDPASDFTPLPPDG